MKTNKPVISIVLLFLPRQQETKRCIDSIFSHTKISFEIIVVDMGMSGQVFKWLKKLSREKPNIKTLVNRANTGTTKGRNQGTSIADGKYTVFIDNDTKVAKGWVKLLIKGVESSEDIAACGSKIGFALRQGNDLRSFC